MKLSYVEEQIKEDDQGRYPIHLATESCDEKVLEVLLRYSEVLVDVKWNGKTAFDLYLEIGSRPDNRNIETCVQQLIDRHALVNIDSLNTFLNNSNRSNTNVSFVKNLFYKYKDSYDPNQSDQNAIQKLEESLTWKLQNHGPPDNFALEEDDRQFISNSNNKFVQRLLGICIVIKNLDAAKQIIEQEYLTTKPLKMAERGKLPTQVLTKCCQVGNYEMIEWFFEKLPNDVQHDILKREGNECLLELMRKIDPRNNACPYLRCFKLCVSNPYIEIDGVDNRNCTALHFAAVRKLAHVQELLLQKGAYLGGSDDDGVHTICEIDPTVLGNFFDSCIFTNGEDDASKERIYVRLRNFVPPYYKYKICSNSSNMPALATFTDESRIHESELSSAANQASQTRIDQIRNPSNQKKCSNYSIMPALAVFTDESRIPELSIADKQARQTLIEHPLISILLHLCTPIETNYAISCFKALRMLPLVILFTLFSLDRGLGIPWVLIGIWAMFLCRIVYYLLESWNIVWDRISEIRQKIRDGYCKQSIIHLLQQWVVYIRLAQIAILAWLVVMTIRSNYTAVLALGTIQAGYEMTQYLASWDWFSESIYMLKVVLSNICKNIVPFFFILVTFALTFTVIVRLENVTELQNNLTTLPPIDPSQQEHAMNSTTLPGVTQESEADNVTIPHQHHISNDSSLSDVKQSLLKVFVMFTGELGVEVFEFETNFNYGLVAVFVLFIVVVPIAIANLLTALAVNDIS
uniref:Ion transport domain-containing protein n=1 Tax=Anopheles dirus TaxID=7168 RepID=A0A182NQP8_9DIPT